MYGTPRWVGHIAWVLMLAGPAMCRVSVSAQPEEAPRTTTVGLAELVTSHDFEGVISRSFETILPDTQRASYAALAEEERSAYRRRFWLRHDPSPATSENEFLEEHLRRLEYALCHFCPCAALDWDERGDIALRFGLPESRSRTMADISLTYGGLGITPSTEVWNYASMAMLIQFIDPNLDGRYQVGFDTKHFTAHGPPKIQVDARDPKIRYEPAPQPIDVEAMFAAERMHREEQKGQKAMKEVPISYAYTPPAEPIPFYYEVVTSRGDSGMTDVAINYQVPSDCLSFDRSGEGRLAALAKRVRIMSDDYDVITTDTRSVTAICGDETTGDDLLTDEWRIEARPGSYIIGVSVEDTLTGRRGQGRSAVRVPDYWGSGLRMSDIQLASMVTEGERFRRMAGMVVPNPSHAFSRNDQMIVYFELYGLTEDRPGVSRFTITTEITGENRGLVRSWVEELFSGPQRRRATSSEILGTGDVPDSAYWFAVSLENLPQDNYEIVVLVKDVRSKVTVSGTAPFTVLEN